MKRLWSQPTSSSQSFLGPSGVCSLALPLGSCDGLWCISHSLTSPLSYKYLLLTCYISLRACMSCVMGNSRQKDSPWSLLSGKEADIEKEQQVMRFLKNYRASSEHRMEALTKSGDGRRLLWRRDVQSFLPGGELEWATPGRGTSWTKGQHVQRLKEGKWSIQSNPVQLQLRQNPSLFSLLKLKWQN